MEHSVALVCERAVYYMHASSQCAISNVSRVTLFSSILHQTSPLVRSRVGVDASGTKFLLPLLTPDLATRSR